MASEITKEKLLNDSNKIKDIIDFPSLYLENYFIELRNDIDKEFALKQLELQNDEEKKKDLNELWQKIIEKTDSFEKSCIKSSYDLEKHKTRINKIETILNNQETINLKKAEEEIKTEEINLLKILFQNKTILFLKNQKLVILNDEFISKTSFQKR